MAPGNIKEALFKQINERDKGLITAISDAVAPANNALKFLDEEFLGNKHTAFLQQTLGHYESVGAEGLKQSDILSAKHEAIEKEWERLLRSAIAHLRTKDKREPFHSNATPGASPRQPTAYGVEDLHNYFKKFVAFEDILYGADRWYRDHVVHAYRVWLIGMNLLLAPAGKTKLFVHAFIREMGVDGFKERRVKRTTPEAAHFSYCESEIYCIWTIIALTHDLGYPLEKAPKLLHAIHSMVTNFIATPDVRHDFRFNAAADSINDYIVRLMSTKITKSKDYTTAKPNAKIYTGRVQPKYYVKFLKSLELSKHGIISSILVYKHLVFFLESECNIAEDYYFSPEEARQFYVRREILRAMATHTCDDIYQMYSSNMSFLLFFSDELQDWGRNKYNGIRKEDVYMFPPVLTKQKLTNFEASQDYFVLNYDAVTSNHENTSLWGVIQKVSKEYNKFVKIFRDGIDTKNRTFSYTKEVTIKFSNRDNKIVVRYNIPKNNKATISYTFHSFVPDTFKSACEVILSKHDIPPGPP